MSLKPSRVRNSVKVELSLKLLGMVSLKPAGFETGLDGTKLETDGYGKLETE